MSSAASAATPACTATARATTAAATPTDAASCAAAFPCRRVRSARCTAPAAKAPATSCASGEGACRAVTASSAAFGAAIAALAAAQRRRVRSSAGEQRLCALAVRKVFGAAVRADHEEAAAAVLRMLPHLERAHASANLYRARPQQVANSISETLRRALEAADGWPRMSSGSSTSRSYCGEDMEAWAIQPPQPYFKPALLRKPETRASPRCSLDGRSWRLEAPKSSGSSAQPWGTSWARARLGLTLPAQALLQRPRRRLQLHRMQRP